MLEENAIRAVEDQDSAAMQSELTLPCSVKFPHIYAGFVLILCANPLKVIRTLFCFSGCLINELSSQSLPKTAVIFPLKIVHQPFIGSS